jgi:hypothetical protein
MKNWLWRGMRVASVAFPALSGAVRAGDYGCSDATLKGEYAFGVTSYTPPGLSDGPPQVVAGIKVFDGKGKFTQRDYIGDSLRTRGQTDFATGETGTYTVNSDCTGGAVINLNVPGTPPPHRVIQVVFVISGGGRHIHEVVSESLRRDTPNPSPPRPVSTPGRSRRSRTTEWHIDPEEQGAFGAWRSRAIEVVGTGCRAMSGSIGLFNKNENENETFQIRT